MKKTTILILFSLFVVFSGYSQKTNTRKIKKHSKNIYKQQKELLETQITETQSIINLIDSTTNYFEYHAYKNILEKLNSQLEITEKKGSKYYFNTENTTNDLKLIGEWHLENYEDNIERSEQELIDLENSISQLKENMRLIFYPDFTFQRYGFTPDAENGSWRLSEDTQKLYMKNNNSNLEDELNIEILSENSLILIIEDPFYDTTTKLLLKKQ